MTDDTAAPVSIETTQLSKRFGSIEALRRIDLRVQSGETVALFGPNGAGKTTLIRILTLSLRPGSGTFAICGLDSRTADSGIRGQIGLISHQSLLYDDLSARQNLEFYAALYGVPSPARRAEELLQTVDLSRRADDPLRTLSRGMQQRASLARALVHDPRIVFLDEPFTGLDPHAARMLRRTLERLKQRQRTVFLVTHNLAQGLEISDRWMLLSRGEIVDRGHSQETDRQQFETRYFERLAASEPRRVSG